MSSGRKKKLAPRQLVKANAFNRHAETLGLNEESSTRIQYQKSADSGTVGEQATVPGLLNVGFEQLYSFYAPSLESGQHVISVVQTISNPGETSLVPSASQNFEVVGPRFNLPDGEVRSSYPPQGHGDHLQILPHVVLEDPHLPWERPSSIKIPSTDTRHRIPWLALMVFEQSEIRLPAAQLAGNSKIFISDTKQSPTWAVNMSINDLWKMQGNGSIATPVQSTTGDPIDSTTSAQNYDFVFLTPDLFRAHFLAYDDSGNPVANQTTTDVSRYEYLAHVRNINTAGMPDDATGGDEQGLFSVVLAHRTGSWTIKSPTPVAVHLVSIEGVEGMSLNQKTSYVALSSLYSWTYNCLPVDSFNCYDTMTHLADTVDVLAAPVSITANDVMTKTVVQRITDGYTLGKWKVNSGEETAAMWRGPFTPTNVAHHLTHQSTFSGDLQLLDPEIGIMDVSYSVAWQLGKTMAIADQTFTAAISRMRSTIHDQAYQAIKAEIKSLDQISIPSVAASLTNHITTLNSKSTSAPNFSGSSKWQATSATTGGTGFFSPDVRQKFLDAAINVVKQNLAACTDSTQTTYLYYNEHNKPVSSDWALMLDWVLNRLFFYGVPAHYLITDPSVLPKESMRFFLIDSNWTDAFLDGAFSICNHIEGDDDQMRTALKTVLNDYLTTVDPSIKFAPQIPKSGFLLRSALVTQFPDIIVKANWANSGGQLPIIRQEFLAEDTLLVLFNRVPGDGLLVDVVISQPPHQQCFAAADNVGPSLGTDGLPNNRLLEFEVGYKQIYNDQSNQRTGKSRIEDIFQQTWYQDSTSDITPTQYYAKAKSMDFTKVPPTWSAIGTVTPNPPNVYDWSTRCLIFPAYAKALTQVLIQHMSLAGAYTDTEPNSSAVAIQLNEPMYQFSIDTSTVGLTSSSVASAQPLVQMNTLTSRSRAGITPSVPSHLANSTASTSISQPASQTTSSAKSAASRVAVAATTQLSPSPTSIPTLPHRGVTNSLSIKAQVTTSLVPGPARAQFKIQCHPAGSPLGTAVPTRAGYFIDLIFSVTFQGFPEVLNSGSRLWKLWLIFPLADNHTPNCLTSYYAGQGGRMLSNLRWNSIVEPAGFKNGVATELQFILMPRSSTAPPSLSKCLEMGFVISGVDVNQYVINQQWTPTVYEQYLTKSGQLTQPILNKSLLMVLKP